MILLEHSAYGKDTIAAGLGLPEYSYWFVRKAFSPILQRFGVVAPVASPLQEVDPIFRSAQAHGQPCVFLSFSPPHQTPLGLACPTLPVFAWEYDTIPDEVWNDEGQNDWRSVLQRVPAAVTHSGFSVGAVRRALGPAYPVWSIPAPVADRQNGLITSAQGWRARTDWTVSGALVFDTREIDLQLFGYGEDARSVRAMRLLQAAMRDGPRQGRRVELEGVVYTTVLNPVDGRKNWADMAAAFIYAFRHEPAATLILKTTHHDLQGAVIPILQDLAKLGRFRCRILVVHGLLDDEAYRRLVELTSYAVNTSHGEGQCLPLMEFMAAGRPAVAPRHTAMLDYVSDANSFVVADHQRPAYWPHDVRQANRCLRHQVEFASLVRRYRESFTVARGDPERYRDMSQAAREALVAFCSDTVVSERLAEVFQHLQPQLQPSASTSTGLAQTGDGSAEVDGFVLGLKDSMLTGWFNSEAWELAPGFPVGSEDVAVDVGCGDGGPASFCARAGAHVILADVDGPRLEKAAERLRAAGASQVDAYCTDADPLPLADGAATRVICMEVMEHVEDPAVLMAELHRVGAPGALYLLTVPGHVQEHLQEGLAPPQYFQRPNHIRIIDPDAFEALVTGAGLVVERRYTYGFYWALWWAFFWQCGADLENANLQPLLQSWARTWNLALQGRDGARIQAGLNAILPKSQVIIARKPL